MNLRVLLPFGIFADKTGVSRIVAETSEGSFGLLPHRLDCVAALTPGIVIYETQAEGEVFVAVDEGVLVKTGPDVLVSVRRAIGGEDLGRLRDAVDQEFLTLDEHEQSVRSVMARLETGFLRRFASLTSPREKPRRTRRPSPGRSARRRRASSRRGVTPRPASGSAWA
jgi:F-type H+-transporting ATPase subunit epsilon